jgi:predicted branched-subunit amino acid permease
LIVPVFSVVAAIPGLPIVFHYTHRFDNAAWFYNLRALRYPEWLASGTGLLAGFVHSLTEPESAGEKLAMPAVLFVLVRDSIHEACDCATKPLATKKQS